MFSVIDDDRPVRSAFAVRFIGATAAVIVLAAGLAVLLIHFAGTVGTTSGLPVAFWLSTLLLLAGSVTMHRAVGHVRRERQFRFRRALVVALVSGILFVGLQSWGLWELLQQEDAARSPAGAMVSVFTAAALHGLHFSLALLLLVFVTLHAFADRYDHEYYWGVVVCAWLWHALGVVWLAILGVLAIST